MEEKVALGNTDMADSWGYGLTVLSYAYSETHGHAPNVTRSTRWNGVEWSGDNREKPYRTPTWVWVVVGITTVFAAIAYLLWILAIGMSMSVS